MHFATYEFCKSKFKGGDGGHHPLRTGAAGICATVSDWPLETVDVTRNRS